jgi:trehalose 2-sulfotransferase
VARPAWSYILWFTQRVGSTLLAQALEDTGVAGRPREWLEAPSVSELLATHGARDVGELRDSLWNHGTTANRVFGLKYGMRSTRHSELTALFGGLVGDGATERAAWDAIVPACRHVHVTRRDPIRLAISWWRAIQSGEWHRPLRPDTAVGHPPPPATEPRYDADAIAHLAAEVGEREAAIHEVFARWSVTPHVVCYEDTIAAFDSTVRGVLRFLDAPASTPIPEPAFAQLADDLSDRWYARFVRERR